MSQSRSASDRRRRFAIPMARRRHGVSRHDVRNVRRSLKNADRMQRHVAPGPLRSYSAGTLQYKRVDVANPRSRSDVVPNRRPQCRAVLHRQHVCSAPSRRIGRRERPPLETHAVPIPCGRPNARNRNDSGIPKERARKRRALLSRRPENRTRASLTGVARD